MIYITYGNPRGNKCPHNQTERIPTSHCLLQREEPTWQPHFRFVSYHCAQGTSRFPYRWDKTSDKKQFREQRVYSSGCSAAGEVGRNQAVAHIHSQEEGSKEEVGLGLTSSPAPSRAPPPEDAPTFLSSATSSAHGFKQRKPWRTLPNQITPDMAHEQTPAWLVCGETTCRLRFKYVGSVAGYDSVLPFLSVPLASSELCVGDILTFVLRLSFNVLITNSSILVSILSLFTQSERTQRTPVSNMASLRCWEKQVSQLVLPCLLPLPDLGGETWLLHQALRFRCHPWP